MRKKIGRKIYDTDKSDYVGRNVEGAFGDPHGFAEDLYKKNKADFFLLVSGGPESQYPEEDIIPIELDDAKEWIKRVCGADKVDEFITEKDYKELEKKAAKKSSKKSSKKSTKKK